MNIKQNISSLAIKFRITTIVIFIILNVFLAYGIQYIVQDDDITKLLPQDLEAIVTFDDIRDEFGNSEFMYIAIGNKNINSLNPELLKIVWEISNKLEKFTAIEEVISVSKANKIYFDHNDSSIVVEDLMIKKDVSKVDINSINEYLNDNAELKKQLISKNNDYLNIIIRPKNNDNYSMITNFIHSVTDQYENYKLNNQNLKLEYHYGGQAYVTGATPGLVSSEVKILVSYGLILMCLVLLINLKSIPAVSLIITVISLSLFGMLGFMGWIYKITQSDIFYFTLNHTSMPIVLLTIANSDGVHVIGRFFKELRNIKNTNIAIHKTMEHLIMPISLTSITTALAFLTLIFSPLNGMNGYGIVLAFGICWAWILSLTLLPSLVSLIKWNPNSKAISKIGIIEKLINKFGELVT